MPKSERGGQWRQFRHDSGEVLDFEFFRSSRKTLAICIRRDASVQVRAPLRAGLAEVAVFIGERWAWIQSQRQRFIAMPAVPEFRYAHGETFLHLGEPLALCVLPGRRNRAWLHESALRVSLAPDGLDDYSVLERLISVWQRQQAAVVFAQRLLICHQAMSALALPQPSLRIRKMRTRWGSCTRAGVITLNQDLVRMPLACIDYVITHELCHLIEFNHSPRFYALQSRFMPDWKHRKTELEALARSCLAS